MKGNCPTEWRGVADAFGENFASRGELGAALCVYVDGREILHLWGGQADHAGRREWMRDTIVAAASSVKGMFPFCVHRLVAQGRLAYDRPVADYWPGFAANGKSDITVRHLVSHWAGLEVQFPIDVYSHEIDPVMATIEAAAPARPTGTVGAYHSQTFMPLMAGLVYATTGEDIHRYFRREIAGPWAIDAHLRLPESEFIRAADTIVPADNPYNAVMATLAPTSAVEGALVYPPRNGPLNAYASARGYARLFGGLAAGGTLDGCRLFDEEQVADIVTIQWTNGADPAEPEAPPALSGAMGLFGSGPFFPMGPGACAVGAPGAGGNLGLSDPERRLGVGYVVNSWASPDESGQLGSRVAALLDAIYRCF